MASTLSHNATVMMTPVVAEAGSREAPMALAFLSEEEGVRVEASIRPTKLFIGGISRHTTTKQLRDHFAQFGRVLDCVAMRQPDGRPRGFGYVTLDSPAAAARCLCEPQCIDNRIVDLKPAVPEGSGSGCTSPKEATFNMNMCGEQAYGAWHDAGLYGAMPWWVGDPLEKMTCQQNQGLDCLDILNSTRGQMMSPDRLPLQSFAAHEHLDETGFHRAAELGAMHASSDPRWSRKGASATLSASAPEFVPSGTQIPTEVKQCPATGTTPPSNARKASRARAPLGELTNIVEVDDLLKPFKSPSNKTADIGHGHLSVQNSDDRTDSPSSAAVESPDMAGSKLSRSMDLGLDDKASNNELSPNDTSTAASLLSPPSASTEIEDVRPQEQERDASDEDDEDTDPSDEDGDSSVGSGSYSSVPVDMENLPSVGSAMHGTGKDCSYCHFPHDKRKPSRQEKRERRAAWLEAHGIEQDSKDLSDADQQTHQVLQPSTHSSSFLNNKGKLVVYQDEDVCSDETMAYSVFPGLQTICATKLPAPLALPGAKDILQQTGPVLPPGLTPPHPWQPEAEASPVALLSTSQTMPGSFDRHSNTFQTVASAPLTSAFLSTAPSPVATPTAATRIQAGTLPTIMCTVATQTVEDYMCQECEKETKAELSSEKWGHQWSRDELLRLRGGIVATQAGEVSKVHNMKIIAIPGI